jgi:hypothetical protein
LQRPARPDFSEVLVEGLRERLTSRSLTIVLGIVYFVAGAITGVVAADGFLGAIERVNLFEMTTSSSRLVVIGFAGRAGSYGALVGAHQAGGLRLIAEDAGKLVSFILEISQEIYFSAT